MPLIETPVCNLLKRDNLVGITYTDLSENSVDCASQSEEGLKSKYQCGSTEPGLAGQACTQGVELGLILELDGGKALSKVTGYGISNYFVCQHDSTKYCFCAQSQTNGGQKVCDASPTPTPPPTPGPGYCSKAYTECDEWAPCCSGCNCIKDGNTLTGECVPSDGGSSCSPPSPPGPTPYPLPNCPKKTNSKVNWECNKKSASDSSQKCCLQDAPSDNNLCCCWRNEDDDLSTCSRELNPSLYWGGCCSL